MILKARPPDCDQRGVTGQDSAESFIEQNPELLDSKIMMTHYSAEVLISDEARTQFVEPDLDPIPNGG
ncbi:MAG: hypothetical protein IH855_11050 [Bacteroidetes bacterium]|nr:hypothetical protein [Bacteroidota bacterium]